MILALDQIAMPEEIPVRRLDSVAPRLVRGYTRRVGLAEIAARRATPREFKVQDGWIWQRKSVERKWTKVLAEILPISFAFSLDYLSAGGVDMLLGDGSMDVFPATAITNPAEFERWCAWNLIDLHDAAAAQIWLRSVLGGLRDVRFDRSIRYAGEESESAVRHLIRIAETATGKPLRVRDGEEAAS